MFAVNAENSIYSFSNGLLDNIYNILLHGKKTYFIRQYAGSMNLEDTYKAYTGLETLPLLTPGTWGKLQSLYIVKNSFNAVKR
jgi:hypothetical protein